MSKRTSDNPNAPKSEGGSESELERAAARGSQGVLGELAYFLRRSRKWWLVPTLIALLLMGGLIVLAASGAAPFIYTVF
jgi:hypothetical protein